MKLPDQRKGKRRLRAILKARIAQLQPPKPAPEQQQDEFFEIQVTEADIRAWLIAVPRFADPDGWRARRYAINYDVAGKIRAHKAAGTFLMAINPKGSSPP